jgi:hypothetical protein
MSKPIVSPNEEQHEARILQGVADLLSSATGSEYYYDSDGAYLVKGPTTKHLAEASESTPGWPRTIYFVHPGSLIITPDTGCTMRFEGDLMVTAGVRVYGPELPWEANYVPVPRVQLRIFEDLYRAINAQEILGATLFVADRNLDIDVDGWAIVQAQVSLGYSEGVQGES